jgi:LacI family transcriptional regulator, gluconate utilization system Gnt-I transcriptional repressor
MNDSRKRRPTLQDIADLTGVTKMTVSRYLRDPQAVAEATPEREEEQVASLLSYHVDALILSDSLHTPRTRKMIATAGIPVVETMDLPEQPIDLVVGMDHRAAAQAMVTEMLSRGRRRPIYLGAQLDVRTRLRMEGYDQAMA